MMTRNKAKEQHLSFVARNSTKLLREPSTTKEVLRSTHWIATMHEEIDFFYILTKHGSWCPNPLIKIWLDQNGCSRQK